MPAPGRPCLILAVVLAFTATVASVHSEAWHHNRKLSVGPIQTCKKQAATCSTAFLPLFEQCCDGQNLTCWQGPVLDTTRCVKRPQPPMATFLSAPGNWTIIVKPQGFPPSLAPQLFCSSSNYLFLTAKNPWGHSFSTNYPIVGNSSACLNGPQQNVFHFLPGMYKCGTQYDVVMWTSFNNSNSNLTSDVVKAPGSPVTAPPCLQPTKWVLTIHELTCTYRYLQTKACAEGKMGINVAPTIFMSSDYLQRLFTIQPAPGHSGALVDAGTPVNIIGAGRAGNCAALLASASSTCTNLGLGQSPNTVARPSQWVLESAGKPGLVYIRSVGRTAANCPARYLGASKATCSMPYDQFEFGAASLFVKNSPGARTVWRLERA